MYGNLIANGLAFMGVNNKNYLFTSWAQPSPL